MQQECMPVGDRNTFLNDFSLDKTRLYLYTFLLNRFQIYFPSEYGRHLESALPGGNIIHIFFKQGIERLFQSGDGSVIRIIGPDIFHIASP